MPSKPTAAYDQRTGEFTIYSGSETHDEPTPIFFTAGYSGHGPCRNNPNCEAEKGRGPIPVGMYRVSRPFTHHHAGPLAFRLDAKGHSAKGRSGFLIHGDNPTHDASKGCIILWRSARETLAEFVVLHSLEELEVYCSVPASPERAGTRT